MKAKRFFLLALTLFVIGCAPAETSSKFAGIVYEHDGYKLGDTATSDMVKRATPGPDGTVVTALETKNIPHYTQTLLFTLDNKIAEIGFDFDKQRVNEVYSYNEAKYGKPEGSNDKLWIWNLQEGGVFILNREGWGKVTSQQLMMLRDKQNGTP